MWSCMRSHEPAPAPGAGAAAAAPKDNKEPAPSTVEMKLGYIGECRSCLHCCVSQSHASVCVAVACIGVRRSYLHC